MEDLCEGTEGEVEGVFFFEGDVHSRDDGWVFGVFLVRGFWVSDDCSGLDASDAAVKSRSSSRAVVNMPSRRAHVPYVSGSAPGRRARIF